MVDVGGVFDTVGGLLVAASVIVGLFGASQSVGSVSDILVKASSQPLSFGVGFLLFCVSFLTWTPAYSPEFLGQNHLGFLSWFFPFSNGYVPSFSLWTLIFSIVVTVVVTWLYLYFSEQDFWFHGLGVAFGSFVVSWYGWLVAMWFLMPVFGGMIGLQSDAVREIWLSSVLATKNVWVQYFLLVSVPVSVVWFARKFGDIL